MQESFLFYFFFNDTAPTEIYTLSLHDALPSSSPGCVCLPAAPPGTNSASACTAWRSGTLRFWSCRSLRVNPGCWAYPSTATAAMTTAPATAAFLAFTVPPLVKEGPSYAARLNVLDRGNLRCR